jgi:hypothetical protein
MNSKSYTRALPNHAYYTLNFRNNGINGEAEDARVDYLEVRNNPYLLEPDLYACSIVRFSVTTATLPIFIPQMSPDFSNDPNDAAYQKTVYSVTMSFNGGPETRTYVKYLPQTTGLSASPAGNANDATTNPYYYVYQAAQFVVMVNNALATCFSAVIANSAANVTKCPVYIDWIDKDSQAIFYAPRTLCQEPGFASQPTPSVVLAGTGTVGTISGAGSVASPWQATVAILSTAGLIIGQSVSASNGTGSLYGGSPTSTRITAIAANTSFTYQVIGGTIPTAGDVTVITATGQLKVWFNSALFNLFSSFQAVKEPFSYGSQVSSNGKHFRYQWWNIYNSKEQTAETFVPPNLLGRGPAQEEYLAINQSYSVVPLWNPVKAIVFTTSLLPVLPEMVSAAQSLGSSTSFSNNGNNADVQNVLTDFEVELITGEETRPVVYYVPTAEYRMVDLQSNQPLSAIQLSVSWRNKFGALVPLNLGTDGNAQIKILFRRRDWQS